ncbi:MAG TPA: Rid family hydrolase [Rhizomicrobium sp.]|jgi:2-iminobutanoate/2-iminopropanoate deaminase
MKPILFAVLGLCVLPALAFAAPVKHFPAGGGTPGGASPAFSAAVQNGDTLYVSGTTDGRDPDTGKLPADAKIGAKIVLNNVKKTLEDAGYTMDDLVWVQIFASDLKDYGDFNAVYRTYFKGPLPARAFLGAGSLLGGAHFEVMGIAVKQGGAR